VAENPTVHAASFAAILAMSSPWCRAPSRQRIIESIEALVRIHNAQEEDICEHAVGT
jgi:hypothetical protein